MAYKVVLGDLFISDLAEIVSYIAKRADEQTAKRIGNELSIKHFHSAAILTWGNLFGIDRGRAKSCDTPTGFITT